MKASFRVQNVIEKISMLSLVTEDFKKSVCSSVHLSQIVVWHSVTGPYSCFMSPYIAHQPD